MPGHETTYLVETIGHAVSQGVAATVVAQPADPVEYLAEWLLRCVKNEQLQEAYTKEKKQQLDQQERIEAQAIEEQKQQVAAEAAQKAAIDGLASMLLEPATLWQRAVHLVQMYTSAAGVYVANIVDEQQQPAQDGSATEETPADAVNEDEQELDQGVGADAAAAAAVAADEQAADEENTAEDADHPAGEGEDGSAAAANGDQPTSQPPPDYSSKVLQYVAASSGHEFMTKLELKRPKAADEDAGDAKQQAEEVPITFKILDEHMPLLEVPNVTSEPRVKFLRGFPRIGAYCAAAVPAGLAGPAGGAYHAIIAADTLLPSGHGQPFKEQEVAVVWDIAQALGKALDAAAHALKEENGRGGAAEVLAGLAAAVAEVRKAAQSPAAVPEVGEEPAANEAEEGAELTPADTVDHLNAEVQYLQQKIAAGEVTAANAAAAMAVEKDVLAAIVKAITAMRGVAIHTLKLFSTGPPATFQVLKAVLLMLGRDSASLGSWREARAHLHLGTFEELSDFDATQARDPELWKRVHGITKAVRPTDLEKELPQSGLGVMLLQWLQQARIVARKAAAVRDADNALAVTEEARTKKEQQLKEAKVKAQEAEAAAAAAAAQEAAAAGEYAEQEDGEEGEEAEE